jgi:hypothetical protein
MSPEKITHSEAKEKGLKRYFTGVPCASGHLSERYTKTRCCVICNYEKATKYRQRPEVKEKYRQKHYLKTYNMSLDDVNKATNCGICNISLVLKGYKDSSVCVDHDHNTGKVRGFLCNHCNRALGLFKDNPINLENAIKYLQEHGKGTKYVK